MTAVPLHPIILSPISLETDADFNWKIQTFFQLHKQTSSFKKNLNDYAFFL